MNLFLSSQPLTNETNLLPEEMMNSSLYKEPVDPAKWFGIRKDATVLGYSKVYSICFLLGEKVQNIKLMGVALVKMLLY